MLGKGLPVEWIGWVMQIVKGGRVCVNVNGYQGRYFKTYQGLRQGDPLSPILFNLVAGAPSAFLDKAVQQKRVVGYSHILSMGGFRTSDMLMIPSL